MYPRRHVNNQTPRTYWGRPNAPYQYGYGYWNVHSHPYRQPPMNAQPGGTNGPRPHRQNTSLFQYEVDKVCHPTNLLCATKDLAYELLIKYYGGFFREEQCIQSDSSNKRLANGVVQWKYFCRACQGPESWRNCTGWKCNFRAQIRKLNDQYGVFTRPKLKGHNHHMDSKPEFANSQHGLQPTVRRLVEENIRKSNKCVVRIKAMEIVRWVVKEIQINPELQDIRYFASEQSHYVHMKRQVISFVASARETYVKEQLADIRNADSLSRVLSMWKFDIPPAYIPHLNFRCASELATDLGLDSTMEVFIYDLSNGKMYEAFKNRCVPPQPSKQREYEEKMEFAFLSFSISGLYQLLMLSKRRDGTRECNMDGTRGLCRDLSTLITIGAYSVKLRFDVDKVSSSMRVMAYLHVGGERYYPVALTLYVLRELCWKLFKVEFTISWGECDNADAFVGSYRMFKQNPTVLDDVYRHTDNPNIQQQSQTNECIIQPIQCLTEEEEDAQFVPIVTQPSQDECSDYETCTEGHCKQTRTKNPTCDCPRPEVVLQCAFHALQPFAKNSKGYASKFKNRKLVRVERSKKKEVVAAGAAYYHALMIWLSKTPTMRDMMLRLIDGHWRHELKEVAAADNFRDEYGTYPNYNWNVSASGEAGVYGTGNPLEWLNRFMKSSIADLIKNATMSSFLVWNLPKMHEDDALLRFDPCTIEFPKRCSRLMVAVTGYMRWGVDIVPVSNDKWITNSAWRVGSQITNNEKARAFEAYSGKESAFKETEHDSFVDVAARASYAANPFCTVSVNPDGYLVGNCNDCVQHLGYNCCGATWLRSHYGHFTSNLETSWKTAANTRGTAYKAQNRGNLTQMYYSGLCSSKSKREIKPALRNFEDYMRSLTKQQMSNVVDKLCLVLPTVSTINEDTPFDENTKEPWPILEEFGKDPTKYRSKRKLTLEYIRSINDRVLSEHKMSYIPSTLDEKKSKTVPKKRTNVHGHR